MRNAPGLEDGVILFSCGPDSLCKQNNVDDGRITLGALYFSGARIIRRACIPIFDFEHYSLTIIEILIIKAHRNIGRYRGRPPTHSNKSIVSVVALIFSSAKYSFPLYLALIATVSTLIGTHISVHCPQEHHPHIERPRFVFRNNVTAFDRFCCVIDFIVFSVRLCPPEITKESLIIGS